MTAKFATASVARNASASAAAAGLLFFFLAGTNAHAEDEPTDGLIQVNEDLLALIVELKAENRGSSVLQEPQVERLRAHILADTRIDPDERHLILELSHPYIRALRIYPVGQDDPWGEAGTGLATLSTPNRQILQPLLEVDAQKLVWDDDARRDTLTRFIQSVQQTPELRDGIRSAIASKVAEVAPLSTPDNAYAPFRDLVREMLASVQTMEADGTLDAQQGASARQLFYDAVEDGISASGADIPRFLYNWLDARLGLDGPKAD